MSTVTKLHGDNPDDLQVKRALYLRNLLKEERWSVTAAAARIHMPKSTLAERLRGASPLMLDDIERIAPLVNRTPEGLYAELIHIDGPNTSETRRYTVPKVGATAKVTRLDEYRHASVAQGIEHWFPVPVAAGSNPAGGTTHLAPVSVIA